LQRKQQILDKGNNMSQLTLTPEETVLILNAVRAKHAQTLSAYGVDDPDLAALLDKIQTQLTLASVVEPEVVEEPVTKSKKSKAAE
jgi:hypothetical protein